MAYNPKISILTATLNAEEALKLCYAAIAKQDYPKDKVELIIGDGGSDDKTREVAKKYGAKIANNPLKTAEAGKAAAFKEATGEIIAIIDSDNIMPDERWLKRLVAPFQDSEIIASEPWDYTYRKTDPALTRYFALIGMNDPLVLFLGNYDRRNYITNKWTALPVKQNDKGDYLKVQVTERNLPTIGANGFVIRKSELAKCSVKKYIFDIDLLNELIKMHGGKAVVAKVKTGIVHLYSGDVATFVRKQKRRVKDFLYYGEEKKDTGYPWMKLYLDRVVLFALACITVIPLLIQILIGYVRKPDWIWLFHPIACWITLWVYGWGTLTSLIGGRKPADRSAWRQTK
ncbi:glycosyltransferase [Patescibacteria group bacterium]